MWNCKSIHLAPSLQRRINSFIEDFVCFTKTDDCIMPRNHIYHLGASAGRKILRQERTRGIRRKDLGVEKNCRGAHGRWEASLGFGFGAQREGFILHYTNDHLNKRMGEETALHSINSAFVVSELLMMYKGSPAPVSWTMHALCF